MKKLIFAVLALVLWLPTVWVLARPGFFSMYDDMQVIRLQQMDKCIKDGQIPCRWVPDLGYGYGYPLYEFYAPLPYYVMEGVHLLGWSLIDSVKIGFILAVLASGVSCFALARYFFSGVAALGVATLYVFAPFRAADLYVRGAMGEVWGMAVLPLVFFGVEYLLRKKTWRSVVVGGACVAVFLTTHNLTVLVGLPLLVAWSVVRLVQLKQRNLVGRLAVGVVLGLLLSGFFVVPLVMERNLVHLETLTGGYFNYLAHFVSWKQIFLSLHWGYGISELGPGDDTFLGVGPVHLVLGLVGAAVLLMKRRKEWPVWMVVLGGVGMAVFLAHQRSSFIWQALPFMAWLQFPWRWMVVASFGLAFLGGGVFEIKANWSRWMVVAVWGLLVLVYGSFFTPKDWLMISDSEKLSGGNWQRQVTASIYDYLPKSAMKAPDGPAPEGLIAEAGKVEAKTVGRGSDWFRYEAEVGEGGAKVAVPVYDFPRWKVWVDRAEVTTEQIGTLGLLGVNLLEGKHVVEAKLTRSWSRTVGDGLSLLGLAFCGGILICGRSFKR